MAMNYRYYYNVMPGQEPWRNNLIYTSLINDTHTVFVKWFNNDTDYHKGLNTVDVELMEGKWQRELKYYKLMHSTFNHLVPRILDIDYVNKKLYLEIKGVDFWQSSIDNNCSFDELLPDWRTQMLDIIKAHRSLGLYKYSMHPSSYFIIDGYLVSINYFFTYHKDEGPISIQDHQSHISQERQIQVRRLVEENGISWTDPQPLNVLQNLCWDSFRTNYPSDFIENAKQI